MECIPDSQRDGIMREYREMMESLHKSGHHLATGKQIVPAVLGKMLRDKDVKKSERVMHALLQMKKIDIESLKKAYGQR